MINASIWDQSFLMRVIRLDVKYMHELIMESHSSVFYYSRDFLLKRTRFDKQI